MFATLQRLTKNLWKTQPASRRSQRTAQLRVERLEEREVPTVTDMTGLAQLFPTHSGPTMLYLNFDGYASQGVSSFASTSGNRTQDMQDILYQIGRASCRERVRMSRGEGGF